MAHRAASALPTGTLTFVLGDVEGSVRLWEADRAAMAGAIVRFDAVVSELAAAHRGVRPAEQGEGDSFVAAFPLALDATEFVVALQRLLQDAPWAAALPFRLRVALHTGTAELRDGASYMGSALNRCARLRTLAHGGQVLLSGATRELVTDDLHAIDPSLTLLDLGIHPLRDFDRPEHVFQLCHPVLVSQFPPLHDSPSAAPPLPVVLTSFVARDEEMAAVARLINETRLVTLTGAGGSGKTRMAIECARRAQDSFRDGVGWADAAPVGDNALVASVVAAALGVREVAGEALVDTIVREVAGRDVLVVVDNCEHVIEEVARVCERLLEGCPDVRILATSRESIGIAGETAMRVPSLAADDAVELFVERAVATRPDFGVTDDEAATIREVCRRLDGIPLAIELAAARVRVLTLQQIEDGLADRFRLLTGGSRTALPRQRTLEASVDWSYRLLFDGERRTLGRLSVFAGGFTLDAARAVCADADLPEASVLDLLTALVDKSLVQVDGGSSDGRSRYRMLETIRHFARQRLADDADSASVRERHLDYFLALAEEVGPLVEQGNQLVWLEQLDADIDNLRAALDWAEQAGDTERLIRMVSVLWLWWEVRCRFDEGCGRLRAALAASTEPSRARAFALYGLGDLSIFTLDLAQVAASGEELVSMGAVLDDPVVVARGTTLLGWAACFGAYREPEWAVEALGEMLDALRENDDPWLHGDAQNARGVAQIAAGDLTAAGASFDGALESATRWNTVGGIQRASFMRGWCHTLAGEVDEAESPLNRAVALAVGLDDTFFKALALAFLGYGQALRGDVSAAERHAAEAVALGERFGNHFAMAAASNVLTVLAAMRGDSVASAIVARVQPVAAAIDITWLSAWSSALFALVDAVGGDIAGARTHLDDAERGAGTKPYARAVVRLHRGWVERLGGDDAAAETAWTDAVAAASDAGSAVLTAYALEELAGAAARRDHRERAARLAGAAAAIRDRLGIVAMRWAGVPPPDVDVAMASAALGDEAFAREWSAGYEMSRREAVTLALRGKGGRRRPGSGWESLTPTEVEVVRLASEGLSNPAIAEKLFISRGTVKVHLSHVFSKLGVTSRAELAAASARREPARG